MSDTTKKHKVVSVDSWVPNPSLSFPHDFTKYPNTTPSELPSRIADATIVITSATRITSAGIANASNLQLISCNGTGTDHVEKDAIRERGISLCRVPAQNTDSVAEHAFALYFALRRRIVEMHGVAVEGEVWKENIGKLVPKMYGGAMPRVNDEEVLVVVGYGALGKKIEQIAKALGMTVLIAERKNAAEIREGRKPFEDTLKKGTVFVLVTPLDDSTRDLISSDEFERMDSSAFVINAGRGGVVNEQALVKALRDGQIGGAATDVFEHEPATKENCPLLDPTIPNLILTPHAAWFSARTIERTVATVKANIEGFVAGKPQNMVIHAGEDCD